MNTCLWEVDGKLLPEEHVSDGTLPTQLTVVRVLPLASRCRNAVVTSHSPFVPPSLSPSAGMWPHSRQCLICNSTLCPPLADLRSRPPPSILRAISLPHRQPYQPGQISRGQSDGGRGSLPMPSIYRWLLWGETLHRHDGARQSHLSQTVCGRNYVSTWHNLPWMVVASRPNTRTRRSTLFSPTTPTTH